MFTNIETAEVTKYAGNAFLATKITFINEIADLCEKVGADVHDVARGIGLDGRIGRKFLHPGPGFGGSCFPKDTLALAYTAREANAPQTHRRAGDRGQQRAQEADGRTRSSTSAAARSTGQTVGVLGLTFKPNTDDMRDAPVARHRAGAAGGRARRSSPSIPRAWRRPGSCCRASASPRPPTRRRSRRDVLVVITEWHEFRGLDPRVSSR